MEVVAKKKTLVWREEVALWSGPVEVSVTAATGEHGNRIFSLMFGRCDKKTGERVSGFLRLEDLDHLVSLANDLKKMHENGEFK